MNDKPSIKTFIIYNYSQTEAFNFEFVNSGFNMKDELQIEPMKGKIEANKHTIIKLKLIPKNVLSNFEGELDIKIIWQPLEQRPLRESDKDSLFIRIIKKSNIRVRSLTYNLLLNRILEP
jgi:hypothetical protein